MTVREEKANSLLPFPAVFHVFSFIWFLLLHKSLPMTFTPRRTAWVLLPQGAQRVTGPTGKDDPREGTHRVTFLWKKSVHLSSAVLLHSGFCLNWFYPYLCTAVPPTPTTPLSLSEESGGERRWRKRLIYAFNIWREVLMGLHVATANGINKFLKLALFHYDVPVRGTAGWPRLMCSPWRVLLDTAVKCTSLRASRLLWCPPKSI